MDNDTKLKRIAPRKQQTVFLLGSIRKIAAAANVELLDGTLAVYLEALAPLSETQMNHATKRTIEEWHEASKMPPVAFILERSGYEESKAETDLEAHERAYRKLFERYQQHYRQLENDEWDAEKERLLIEFDSLPMGEPRAEFIRKTIARLNEASQLRDTEPDYRPETHNERAAFAERIIAEWLEAGKEKQRQYIRKLETDPKWREMAERFGGFPGLKKTLPPTQVPADPEKRREWAHKKAIDHGWKSHDDEILRTEMEQ